ncbi:hypothetical protein BC826DRAFT_1043180, partial [Russula brevipes]
MFHIDVGNPLRTVYGGVHIAARGGTSGKSASGGRGGFERLQYQDEYMLRREGRGEYERQKSLCRWARRTGQVTSTTQPNIRYL